ncbi:MAG: hypothetical protein ACFFBL_10970 [Promethearchaeota archaeon]
MLSFGEIFQKIIDMEDELRLFDRTIDGVRFWDYIRQPLFVTINDLIAGRKDALGKGPSVKQRLKFLIISLVRFWKNPIFAKSKDVLFISSPRRVLRKDGFWWDIITDYIMEDLDLSYVSIEHNIYLEHRNPPKTRNLWYFDFQNSLIYIAEKLGLFQVSLSDDEKLLLREIRIWIAKSFGLDVDIEKLTLRHLGYRRIRIPYFSLVLRRIRPKAIVLVTSYGKEDLIEPAKSLGIPVIELQHGVIHQYHSGYSFPGKKNLKTTFPNWLFTFGDYWSKSVDYTIDSKYVVSTGFPYIDEEQKSFSDLTKKKQILVLSQWTIGKDLSKFAAELSKVRDLGYSIIYKLHPLEYTGWQEKYPWLIDTNVEVIDDSRISLYRLFAESEIQIGVYSTSIFEGLAFGLRTYIADMHGVEYTERLIEEGVAVKVRTVEELVNHLKSKKRSVEFDSERFFRKGAKDRIIDLISKIVSEKKANH